MTVSSEASSLHSAMIATHAALYPRFAKAHVERRSGYDLLRCPSISIPQFNGVWANEDGGPAVADLAGAIADIEALGLRFWLQTRERRHPRVEAEAEKLGLVQAHRMPGMVAAQADLNDLPGTQIAIERVTDASELVDAQAVCESGFEAPPGRLAALYGDRLAAAPGFSVYLGRAEGRAVATSVSARIGDTVGIFAVATHPAYRRRGYGAAVTDHAVRNGLAEGAELAWLQSSELGISVYERMGFRSVETYNLFTRP